MAYSSCVACSGSLVTPSPADPSIPRCLADRVQICTACGGIHGTELLDFEARSLVGIGRPMVSEEAPGPIRYFDLEVLRAKAGRWDRVHGWFAPQVRRVVQYG